MRAKSVMSNDQRVTRILLRSLATFAGLVASVLAPTMVFIIIEAFLLALEMFRGIRINGRFGSVTAEDPILAVGSVLVGALFLGAWALIVAGIHVVMLGFPAAVIGQYFRLVRWWSSTAVGFLLGCLPVTLSGLSQGRGASEYAGTIPYMIDGVRTAAGWANFAQEILFMGFFGAIGGFSFWVAWRFWDKHYQRE